MKQFKLYSGMAAVCAMLTFASCGNDIELTEAQAPVKGEYKVTFTASQESSATRTAVDGTNVVWQTGDAITVFDGAGENCSFEIVKGVGTTLGEFQGTITVTEPKSYCAVYPLAPDAQLAGGDVVVSDAPIADVPASDYTITGLVLPVEQVATRDGFDPQAAIMTARNDNADKITSTSEDLSLGEFKHVCAFVKVTTTEDYDKITFTAKGGERIAGGFTAYVEEDGVSSVEPDDDASTTVSLVPAVEGTKIAAGTYFIAILPGTLEEGFIMECITLGDADNQMEELYRSYNGSTSVFSRHNVVNMGTVSTTNGWTAFTPTYVDLGLTSGTKWATCNVGALTPEDYGDYFAWGETEPKTDYSWTSYKWCEGSENTLTKYNTISNNGTVVDNNTVLDASDDAAHVNWGATWRMPAEEDQQELRNNCYWEWTDDYNDTNVKGFIVYKVKDNNDKGKMKINNSGDTPSEDYTIAEDAHIFLPAAGFKWPGGIALAGTRGVYYLSAIQDNDPISALNMWFGNDPGAINVMGGGIGERACGAPVRPVLP